MLDRVELDRPYLFQDKINALSKTTSRQNLSDDSENDDSDESNDVYQGRGGTCASVFSHLRV
jgi:hypothetical protein